MLDALYGKPSPSWRRMQVFLVLLFWMSRLARGNRAGPRIPLVRRINRWLSSFTPYQIIIATLTTMYAIKNGDALLGVQAPEPLARLYSRAYFRSTFVTVGLDAGFATAMNIKPKWLRDIMSIAFSAYYLVYANEADEKLRKYRAVCTVEMLRATWEKTSNPYIRFVTSWDRPKVGIKKRILLPRPNSSIYRRPITAWIYFNGTEEELAQQTQLTFDIPGGGFICMTPEHHEERNLNWCIKTKRPVISFDYGKAPEYPFPYAIDEMYDAYKLLHETCGKCIGMSGTRLDIVLTGDSAGANISTAMVIKLIETRPPLPLPVSLVFAYAALSFHFTSWMPASDLRVLGSESSANIAGLLRTSKDHLEHRSPLSVVEDIEPRPKGLRGRTASWVKPFVGSGSGSTRNGSTSRNGSVSGKGGLRRRSSVPAGGGLTDEDADADGEGEDWDDEEKEDKDKHVSERVLYWDARSVRGQKELQNQADRDGRKVLEKAAKGPLETRLAMTSRTAFFNDRIISPPMCRAMALLYIGPRNAPDLHTDYHISPIFTPPALLAQFPPVYMSCGERDPFVDDTVIFAGKLREAKETRKLELLARESKHGESLRMSTGSSNNANSTSRPIDYASLPILEDEIDEDWVQMKIIEGWSHGYLQMVSILPEALTVIDLMADWIVTSFEKADAKRSKVTRRGGGANKVALPIVVTPAPTRTTIRTTPPSPSPSPVVKPSTLKSTPPPEDDGRNAFPSPDSIPLNSESEREEENVLSFTPKRRSASTSHGRSGTNSPAPPPVPCTSPSTLPAGSSTAFPFPRPSTLLSPPQPTVADFNTPSPVHPRPQHPHERALRDNLLESSLFNESPPPSSTLKTTRSSSTGSAPASFVEAKDLLRRRREEAVFGISANNSRAGSSEEDDEGERNKKKLAKKESVEGPVGERRK